MVCAAVGTQFKIHERTNNWNNTLIRFTDGRSYGHNTRLKLTGYLAAYNVDCLGWKCKVNIAIWDVSILVVSRWHGKAPYSYYWIDMRYCFSCLEKFEGVVMFVMFRGSVFQSSSALYANELWTTSVRVLILCIDEDCRVLWLWMAEFREKSVSRALGKCLCICPCINLPRAVL